MVSHKPDENRYRHEAFIGLIPVVREQVYVWFLTRLTPLRHRACRVHLQEHINECTAMSGAHEETEAWIEYR